MKARTHGSVAQRCSSSGSFVRSFVLCCCLRSLSLSLSFVRSFVRPFVGNVVESFVRSLACSFVRCVVALRCVAFACIRCWFLVEVVEWPAVL